MYRNHTVLFASFISSLSYFYADDQERGVARLRVCHKILLRSSLSVVTHFLGDFEQIIERWQSKRLKVQLPSIPELEAYVNRPLLDNEKIPLDPNRFQSLINISTPGGDWCSREDVEALFRSEAGCSVLDLFFFIVSEPPPESGSESLFHSFWDANVRKILEFLIPFGRSARDTSRHAATGSLRPDFAFILSKLCPFRGEEKQPESNEDPKAELG